MPDSSPVPTEIRLNRSLRELEVTFDDGAHFKYPCEYLRAFSPAAEVKAVRKKGEAVEVRQNINIERVSPVGGYAVQLVFNDGHDTGIYSWKTLYQLGQRQKENWRDYLRQRKTNTKATASGERKIEILYFTTLAHITDNLQESVVLPEKVRTVQDLLARLSKRGELWAQQLDPQGISVTINKQFVALAHEIQDGDEIALVP